ncbi:FAD-dependent oxidoreductase [Chitinophaga tropicalis]|uniref:FAD-dependent oxidoreductase n=1 Tax=Chitinophaga tropicalis TaxID=2683588 RepID=A0A7K1U4I7_9BACT|nr:FAD-dependent oxidoreductase [Chitinophaga tropicalis]MVT09249.1 FAD-dependent oxidoreductase [Chitinophaga tropicalis]
MKYLVHLLLFVLLSNGSVTASNPQESADVIIYGGTSAAVTAAVQVIRMNKSVIIVSPDKHLGGLSSGGLGFTDTGDKSVIGGLAREFYHRIYLHYQEPASWNWQKQSEYGNKGQGTPAMDGNERTMWIFEPHVAEQVFEDFVKENRIRIYREEWLDRDKGVIKKNNRITGIKTLSGKTFTGKMFIDATYEGDLMAAAGVKYRVGREANSEFGEKYNGVQIDVLHHGHYFEKPVNAYKKEGDPASGLLPLISPDPPGKQGEGDKRVQAYCFRLCLTDHPENRVAIEKPAGYDSSQYELLVRVFKTGWTGVFNKFDPIPNHKTDVNNHGPFSMDYIGMNYDYPDASYEKRKEIIAAHETYQKGLLYFITNSMRVPADIRERMSKWGLSRDEFKDNGNWPHQLYIREARRMNGLRIMTENEVLGNKVVTQPVGMGSYTLDSHNTQRYVQSDGTVQNEGDVQAHISKPYQIEYGAIIPKKGECENLLVPVCVSSTHIAYGSIRMEPVFMILGQSAATAAVQAIDGKKAVQDVDYEMLKKQLLKDKQKI